MRAASAATAGAVALPAGPRLRNGEPVHPCLKNTAKLCEAVERFHGCVVQILQMFSYGEVIGHEEGVDVRFELGVRAVMVALNGRKAVRKGAEAGASRLFSLKALTRQQFMPGGDGRPHLPCLCLAHSASDDAGSRHRLPAAPSCLATCIVRAGTRLAAATKLCARQTLPMRQGHEGQHEAHASSGQPAQTQATGRPSVRQRRRLPTGSRARTWCSTASVSLAHLATRRHGSGSTGTRSPSVTVRYTELSPTRFKDFWR
jgi:hypothetical protein